MSNLGTNRILLTGAAGWLGLNLVHALARGIPEHPTLHAPVADLKLRCLLLPGQDAAQVRAICPSAEIVTGDVRNAADCQRFCEGAAGGVLFHTAGIIHPGRVQDFYDINLEGTKNLLAAATTGKVRRAVIVSSNSPQIVFDDADLDAAVPVVISADRGVKYEAVVQAMDALQRAGVQRVGLLVKSGG